MARMVLASVGTEAFLELGEGARFRGRLWEEGAMDVLGGEAATAADENLAGLFVPFEDGAGADAEFTADAGGDRDLTLGGELRISDGHVLHHYDKYMPGGTGKLQMAGMNTANLTFAVQPFHAREVVCFQ
jgi:hypothetical protein